MRFWLSDLIAGMHGIEYNSRLRSRFLKAFEISGYDRNSANIRRIIEYPDISRHLENRLRQTGCSGALVMLKLRFTGKIQKANHRDFQDEGTIHMRDKSFKVFSCMVFITGVLSGLESLDRRRK